MRSVLFHRDFRRLGGGSLKVWDYFNHVRHSIDHTPFIYFSKETTWDESNPWLAFKEQALESWYDFSPDVLFLAGPDWYILNPSERVHSSVPIINLVQSIRCTQPAHRLYNFFQHKAIRICVSREVGAAVKLTSRVNGPVYVIPCGLDIQDLPDPLDSIEKDCDLLIIALKQPELGGELMRRLERSGLRIDLITSRILRSEYLGRVNRAKTMVFLPARMEGFYISALEGMALGTLVVCPDCIGNRSFCLPGYNCFRPEFKLESIAEATEAALLLPAPEVHQMLANARKTVAEHDLTGERKAFLDILENVSQIW